MALPTEAGIGNALQRLAETDIMAAQLKRAVEAYKYVAKKKRAIAFLSASGTVAEREAKAEKDETYQTELNNMFDAIEQSEAIQNERKTIVLTIDVFRTIQANRRQG